MCSLKEVKGLLDSYKRGERVGGECTFPRSFPLFQTSFLDTFLQFNRILSIMISGFAFRTGAKRMMGSFNRLPNASKFRFTGAFKLRPQVSKVPLSL